VSGSACRRLQQPSQSTFNVRSHAARLINPLTAVRSKVDYTVFNKEQESQRSLLRSSHSRSQFRILYFIFYSLYCVLFRFYCPAAFWQQILHLKLNWIELILVPIEMLSYIVSRTVCHRAVIDQIIAFDRWTEVVPLSNEFVLRNRWEYHRKSHTNTPPEKLDSLDYIYVADSMVYLQLLSRNWPQSYRIRWNNAKWGLLRHSRSPILLPIEIAYATFD